MNNDVATHVGDARTPSLVVCNAAQTTNARGVTLVVAMGVNSYDMSDAEAASQGNRPRCPRCEASDPVLTLLTSMTRYFACGRCQHRWEVAAVAAADRNETRDALNARGS